MEFAFQLSVDADILSKVPLLLRRLFMKGQTKIVSLLSDLFLVDKMTIFLLFVSII